MKTNTRLYSDEERKARMKESRKRWEAKNPEKVKAKAKRDRERRKERDKAKVKIQPTERGCTVCGVTKPLEAFRVHGSGRLTKCDDCLPPVKGAAQVQREYTQRNREAVRARKAEWERLQRQKRQAVVKAPVFRPSVEVSKPAFVLRDWKAKLVSEGWRYVHGTSEAGQAVHVFFKGLIVMYVRKDPDKKRFSLLCDNSGQSWVTFGDAEKALRRMEA